MVEVALRFLIEEVGEVEGTYPIEGNLSEHFILKRTASHGIELLGILAFQASPVWVLAALADVTGGGRKLISEISDELMKEGLLDERFETVEGMLTGLEKTSDRLAVALNLPPVDIPGLRREWEQLKQDVQSIPPKNVPKMEKIEGVWERMRRSAAEQGRSVFTVSSLMAVSAVAHVPANLLWLSKAARSAARRTGKVLGEACAGSLRGDAGRNRGHRLPGILAARVPPLPARRGGAVRAREGIAHRTAAAAQMTSLPVPVLPIPAPDAPI